MELPPTNPASTLEPFEPQTGGPAWQAAAEAGFDMSLTAANLRQTAWERIQQHSSALNLALTLRQAYLEQYDQPRRTA